MEQKLHKKQILKKLFFSTLYLSTFTFGGGYVIVSLMKNKFCRRASPILTKLK